MAEKETNGKMNRRLTIVVVVIIILFGIILTALYKEGHRIQLENEKKQAEFEQKISANIKEAMKIKFPATVVKSETIKNFNNVSLRDKVLMHVDNPLPDDPLIEIQKGVFAKKSNVEGIKINGKTYYYALVPDQSFDPCSMGKVKESQTTVIDTIVFDDCSIIIYTINK